MATAKKSVTTRKKPASTTKKTATARKPAQHVTKPAPKSAFMTMKPTIETAYWALFAVAILALGIWVLTLTMRVNAIYDQIDANNAAVETMTTTHITKSKTP